MLADVGVRKEVSQTPVCIDTDPIRAYQFMGICKSKAWTFQSTGAALEES